VINFVVALMVEARPIVDRFKLTQISGSRGFRLYSGENMRLVVTGVGRVSSAAGTAYLGGFSQSGASEGWLNVGIAGHARLPVGTAIHALRITDSVTGRSWYPPQILELPGSGQPLLTVDQPEFDYARDAAYDMEAAAYFPSAIHFSTGELVQCFKVISDNRLQSADGVNKRKTRELIGDHLDEIAEITKLFSALTEDLSDIQPKASHFDHFMQRWHFTVAQQHELRSLLQQWAVRAPAVPVWDEDINQCPSARSVLSEVKDRLARLPVTLKAESAR